MACSKVRENVPFSLLCNASPFLSFGVCVCFWATVFRGQGSTLSIQQLIAHQTFAAAILHSMGQHTHKSPHVIVNNLLRCVGWKLGIALARHKATHSWCELSKSDQSTGLYIYFEKRKLTALARLAWSCPLNPWGVQLPGVVPSTLTVLLIRCTSLYTCVLVMCVRWSPNRSASSINSMIPARALYNR